jgi:hypothetical protein
MTSATRVSADAGWARSQIDAIKPAAAAAARVETASALELEAIM